VPSRGITSPALLSKVFHSLPIRVLMDGVKYRSGFSVSLRKRPAKPG
jgi:hypothetical protein